MNSLPNAHLSRQSQTLFVEEYDYETEIDESLFWLILDGKIAYSINMAAIDQVCRQNGYTKRVGSLCDFGPYVNQPEEIDVLNVEGEPIQFLTRQHSDVRELYDPAYPVMGSADMMTGRGV